MQTIYLETSIICHLTDPPSANPITRACQQLTQLWWHTRCDPASVFISKYVSDDIEKDDPLRALQRLRAIDRLPRYPASTKVKNIAELLILGGGLKSKAYVAPRHIACGMLMNAEECDLPELITPFQLMENSHETLWGRNSR